eukprot:Mycagemm_TRINITY_DN9805_c0_g1::TRINITY_DN9805_c0_g1_i1::g.153::m.153 type:complete len:105 gc:universal TRINITY_DN9805_c0_g1_i1:488-174(-)
MRSLDTSCDKVSEVTGNTEMPLWSIRNGYSLVPWNDPRYLIMRSRRVEILLVTLWSSRITQSETYSSNPCRVSEPSPFSPVMIVVTFFSFSQSNNLLSSALIIP